MFIHTYTISWNDDIQGWSDFLQGQATAALLPNLDDGLGSDVHDLLEGLPKLRIEYCIDDGIHEAVHVAKPRGQDEDRHSGPAVRIQFCTDGVQDVGREEGHPADEEDTWWDENEE